MLEIMPNIFLSLIDTNLTLFSKLPQKLEAFKKFQDDWAMTYRDYLKKKGWPENVIDITEVALGVLTQYR